MTKKHKAYLIHNNDGEVGFNLFLTKSINLEQGIWFRRYFSVVYIFYNRELTQPRRRRHKERHKFAYLTIKNISFAGFVRAFFIFWHFVDVLVLSTTWNELFCSCVMDVSICWQMFNIIFLPLKRWSQLNSKIVKTHFESIVTLNNWETIAETRSYIFRWRSRCRRRRVCVNSLICTARMCSESIAHEAEISRQNAIQPPLFWFSTPALFASSRL